MTFEFEPAQPVKRKNTGRNVEPNPFSEVVGSIALKIDDATSKPQALSFKLDHPTDQDEKLRAYGKVRRQLTKAGQENDPKVTVNTDFNQVEDDTTLVTFWTIPYTQRTRKSEESTASDLAPIKASKASK